MELLFQLYGDPAVEGTFRTDAYICSWLQVEAALAGALADAGVVPAPLAATIGQACRLENIDQARLWEETRVVGYPVLPLVRMVCQALPEDAAAYVHWGATTQDIMDTALALQLRAAGQRLAVLVVSFGDALARQVEAHRGTVMAARTHGQQAVPTTFGAKCAVFLDQVTRDLARLQRATDAAAVVSLFGAGGTSAALGGTAAAVRTALAARLGLHDVSVPWHVARDRLVDVGQAAALASATAVRFAREVVDLSRTEVGELAEADGEYRGASSTMPQKANPITSEAVIGLGVAAGTMAGALLRCLEASNERAAGEWQLEWQALPYVLRSSAAALGLAGQLARDLRAFPARMHDNLSLDQGLALAEAYMMRLAGELGRDRAHAVTYQAAYQSRLRGERLEACISALLGEDAPAWLREPPIEPEDYLGDVDGVCTQALKVWERSRTTAMDGERSSPCLPEP